MIARFDNRYGQLLADVVLAVVVLAVAAVEFSRDILPYLSGDATFTFRSENFFSYSSGLVRRALPGEVIYRLDRLTGAGPEIYSVLILVAWAFFLAVTTLHFRRFARPLEQIFVYLSSFYILHAVDSEIFMVLPFAAMLFMKGRAAPFAVLALIFIAALIRETAILFYIPVLGGFVLRGGWPLKVGTLLLSVGFVVLLFSGGVPDYRLEFDYWPDRGIEGLSDTLLYSFSQRPFGDTIAMHLRGIAKGMPIILPALVFFAGYAAMFVQKRSGSAALTVFFLGFVAVFYVLTFDHGRYFYLLFMMMVLMTTERARPYFDVLGWRPAPLRWFGRFVGRAGDRARTVTALLFALAPSGYWVLTYQPWPRAVRVVLRATGAVPE